MTSEEQLESKELSVEHFESKDREDRLHEDVQEKALKANGHPGTPERSKSPSLPRSAEKKPIWKTPEAPRFKSWSKPSAWSASKLDRFKDEKPQTPPATKYNLNTSSMEPKDFSAAFKSCSPRFKDPKVEVPPPTRYSVVDPTSKPNGVLVGTCFKTTSKRQYEITEKPRSPGPQYDPVISAIDTKKGAAVSSFRSSVDRFKPERVSTPPATKYNVNTSTFQTKKSQTSLSFGSTSPRFDKQRSNSPPATKYDMSKYSDFKKPIISSPTGFASSSDRFFSASEKEAKLKPSVGAYNIPQNLDEILSSRPSRK